MYISIWIVFETSVFVGILTNCRICNKLFAKSFQVAYHLVVNTKLLNFENQPHEIYPTQLNKCGRVDFDTLIVLVQWLSNFHDPWSPSISILVSPCSSIKISCFSFNGFPSVISFSTFNNKKKPTNQRKKINALQSKN